ncbi:hypothetical protein A6R68_11090, partial [Neotoma lepida]
MAPQPWHAISERLEGPSSLEAHWKSVLKGRVMDLVTQTTILPVLFGCLGIFSLFRVLQWFRSKVYLRNAVVVVTGATSGLGR